MLNHITIMGRLTRDPELRRTGSGIAVASFTVAVDRDFSPKDGGEKETDFIDCVAWRQTGEFVSKYFTKGRMAVVSGRLQMRNWTDKEGNKRTSAEVVADNVYFGDSKREGGAQDGFSQGYAPSGMNRQTWQFTVIDHLPTIEHLAKVVGKAEYVVCCEKKVCNPDTCCNVGYVVYGQPADEDNHYTLGYNVAIERILISAVLRDKLFAVEDIS